MNITVRVSLLFACTFLSLTIHPLTIERFETAQVSTGSPILPIQSSNWVATDAQGRSLPTASQVGPFKQNRYVGIFYFLWHGEHNSTTIYDLTKLTKANPSKPAYGPVNAFHWWGEPEAGYYRAGDPWVIRRNLQMLTLAGVDVLFFDVTNASIYLPTVKKLCDISLSMRQDGIPTPYICFLTYSKGPETIAELYKQIYGPGHYSALWFRWQGKPLLLGKKEDITDPTIKNFFTWRYSWAWTNAKNEPHHWQWLDNTPQNYGWDKDPSIPEEIPVAVAGHPFGNNINQSIGKSNSRGRQAASVGGKPTAITNKGLYFAEQWQRALQVNPQMVFVTGWNEWLAQRFVSTENSDKKFLGKNLRKGQTYFVDLYNQEYNRDIEPMKGGYTDDYYYQLVSNIRRFKGMDAPEKASPPKTIKIDGQFAEWKDVKPVYIDPRGDVLHRNYPKFGNNGRYVNTTGRNDIIESRMTYDVTNLYAYAKTNKTLTKSTGKNWMLLYLNTDQSSKTGWQGYDYLINQTITGNQTWVSRWNGKSFVPTSTGQLYYKGTELEIAIPRKSIGKTAGRIGVDFHWADNIQVVTSINEFFINGDNAPDRRFAYRYSN